MVQHFLEAALAAGTAAVLALLALMLTLFAVPVFNEELNLADFFMREVLVAPGMWWAIAATLCAVTLVAGAYPAFVLSNVRPIQAVRAGQQKSARRKVAGILVGVQFASASFLLIAILVMQAQSDYMREASFATLDDPLVVLANNADTPVSYQALREELLRQPHVKSVTATAVAPWQIHGMGPASISTRSDPNATRRGATRHFVNDEFFPTLGFNLLAGRALSARYASDDVASTGSLPAAVGNIMVDRAFADEHGWSPQQAVGKTVYQWPNRDGQDTGRALRIVGVVETKPLSIIEFGVTANAYFLDTNVDRAIVVRVSRNDVRAALQEIDAAWNRVAPNLAIQRQFADQSLNSATWMFDAVSRIFGGVTTLALIIAMLGLIGISIHVLHRRTHEIGVRKTLGASAASVLMMLLADLSKPVVVANLIAWPLAYVLMRAYLSIFTHSSGLSVAPFIASLALTLAVAWIAVSAQALRAARTHPVTVLRYE
jgi:putative ABC transport system permease protein